MAWVRYDDQFYTHPKVTAVITDDPGAIALHVLANTWTNTQKRAGFVPRHQPAVLVCDRGLGKAWADILVKHGLWHEAPGFDCESCHEVYGDLDAIDGYVIHDAHQYRAPGRDRTTPGTSSDLSEKRREAGRKGGMASAARRAKAAANQANEANGEANQANQGVEGEGLAPVVELAGRAQTSGNTGSTRPAETQQTAQANQANGVSKSSNLLFGGVSPVPGTSPNGEVLPDEEHSSATASHDAEQESIRDDVERLCTHLADRIEANGSKRPAIGKKWHDAARLMLDLDGRTERQIHNMIEWCQNNEFWRSRIMSMPKLREKYDSLRLQALPSSAPRNGNQPNQPRSTTDERVAQAQALKAKFASQQPPTIAGEIAR